MKGKKNGFTLIEILTVIIIIGIIFLIAIPGITSYINGSRKSSYISTAKEILSSARNFVTKGKVDFSDTEITYYVPISCIDTENEKQSPFGDFIEDQSYVIITYNGEKYNYYWISRDASGHGIKTPVSESELDEDLIESDIEGDYITPTELKDGTIEIKILDKTNCKKFEDEEVTDKRPEITCVDPTYTGYEITIAACRNGSIIENRTGINSGDYEVVCRNQTTGETVTKSCSVKKADSSITCASRVYNGSEQKTYFNYANCTPTENATAINVGTYTVTCVGKTSGGIKNYNDSSCTNAKITPTRPTIKCSNKTYTGGSVTVATCENGTITQNETAVGIGNYEVKCIGEGNYELEATKTCSVSATAPTITCSNPTYNGNTVTIATCENGTITENETGVEVKSYEVKCTGVGNYAAEAVKYCPIKAKEPTISCFSRTYNGTSQKIATCTNGTITENEYGTNAKSYEVKCTGTGDYGSTAIKTCSIAKANSEITCKNPTYTGASVVIAECDHGDITTNRTGIYATNYNTVCTGASSDGNQNYNNSMKSCPINKASSSVTCATRVYNGSAQKMYTDNRNCTPTTNAQLTNVTNGNVTVTCVGNTSQGYKNYNDSTCNTAIMNPAKPTITCKNPTYTGESVKIATCLHGTISQNEYGTNAGTSYVVKCTGTGNYADTATKTCSINPAEPTIQCFARTYNGESQKIAKCTNGTITENEYGTNAGTYAVKCSGTGNYAAEATVDCAISQQPSTINCTTPTYNGSSQIIATCLNGNITNNESAIDAGWYEVTCLGTGNYDVATKSCQMKPNKPTIQCLAKTYNGTAQTIATCTKGVITDHEKETNVGNYEVKCTGTGNYADTATKTCSITADNTEITCLNPTYTGGNVTIATCSNGEIISNREGIYVHDYTVTCQGSSSGGTQNYSNSSASCSILPANSSVTCTTQTYNGHPQEMYSSSFHCTPTGNATAINVGKYTVTCVGDSLNGYKNYKDSSCNTAQMNPAKPTIICKEPPYTGYPEKLAVCNNGSITQNEYVSSAGNHVVTCTGIGNYEDTATKTCKMIPAEPTITCLNPEYSGYAEVIATCEHGSITQYEHAVELGEYEVKCKGTGNYDATATKTCPIITAAPVITCLSPTYTGNPVKIAECQNGTITEHEYETEAGINYMVRCTGAGRYASTSTKLCSIGATVPTISCYSRMYNGESQKIAKCENGTITQNEYGTEVNNYEVVCTGTGNYAQTVRTTCSITSAPSEITCLNPTYTGSYIKVAECTNGKLTSPTYGGVNGNGSHAGDYTVACKGNTNYSNSVKSCPILKAASSVTCATHTYNGEYQNMYSSKQHCTPTSNATAMDVGTYTVLCEGDEDGGYKNYEDSSCNDAQIKPKEPTITCDEPTYTGGQLRVAQCENGTIIQNEYGTNADDYIVKCKGTGDYDTTATKTCKIKPTTPTITCSGKTYNGNYQDIATCANGTITAHKSEINAGSYTVTCTGTGNYAAEASASCSMAPAKPTITCSEPTYTGGNVIIATCANGTISLPVGAVVIDAGDYEVDCTGTGNYAATAVKSCTNAKAASSITCVNRTYTGCAQQMYSTYSNCTPSTNSTLTDPTPGAVTVVCTGSANYNDSSCTATMTDITWHWDHSYSDKDKCRENCDEAYNSCGVKIQKCNACRDDEPGTCWEMGRYCWKKY